MKCVIVGILIYGYAFTHNFKTSEICQSHFQLTY